MKEKYIKFYQSFHKAFQGKKSNHCSNLISNCRVSLSAEFALESGRL